MVQLTLRHGKATIRSDKDQGWPAVKWFTTSITIRDRISGNLPTPAFQFLEIDLFLAKVLNGQPHFPTCNSGPGPVWRPWLIQDIPVGDIRISLDRCSQASRNLCESWWTWVFGQLVPRQHRWVKFKTQKYAQRRQYDLECVNFRRNKQLLHRIYRCVICASIPSGEFNKI